MRKVEIGAGSESSAKDQNPSEEPPTENDDSKLGVVATILSGLSPKQKLVLATIVIGALAAVAVAAFSLGGSFDQSKHESQISKLESDHSAETLSLKQEIQQLKNNPPKKLLSHEEVLDPLPKLEDAVLNRMSMTEYWSLVDKRKEENKDKFGLERKPVFDIGSRFEWQGTVTGIMMYRFLYGTNDMSIQLEFCEDPQKTNAICIFSPEHEDKLKNVKEGDVVVIAGVMGEHGFLVRCELLERKPKTLP